MELLTLQFRLASCALSSRLDLPSANLSEKLHVVDVLQADVIPLLLEVHDSNQARKQTNNQTAVTLL
jgi:hypothetical protein